ncbi:hypothetical protein [Kocuria sabuli]|uniref:hypothetical protein n=1 Tax=Kocuria sabuli TaxID=3071448 RepID=UPI0034D7A49C
MDAFVERAAQEEWLNGVDGQADVSARCTEAISRDRSAQNFRMLSGRPCYDLLLDILAAYVRQVIPAPDRTEQSFWCVTAMPSTGCTATWQRVAAIIVNKVETLVLGESTKYEGAVYLDGFLNVVAGLRLPSSLDVETVEYRTVGVIQRIQPEAAFLEFAVHHPLVRDAACITAMRLLRKGISMMGRHHCPPLADDIFGCIRQKVRSR